MIQTCRGCQERFVGCHSTCEKYLAAKAEHDAEMEKRNSIIMKERDYIDYVKTSKKAIFDRYRINYTSGHKFRK